MPELFGEKLSKKEFLKRVGNHEQVFGARRTTASEGPAKDTDLIEVSNGRGLNFTIVPDKSLDILWASYKSIPLVWVSKQSLQKNAKYEPNGYGWLRNFSGGLLTTCGLVNTGMPDTESLRQQPISLKQISISVWLCLTILNR